MYWVKQIKFRWRKRGNIYKHGISIDWGTNKQFYQILLLSCPKQNCIKFGTCPYYIKNECGLTRKTVIKSRQPHGDVGVRKYYAENKVGQHLSKLNYNTGAVSANYQWKLSRCITLIIIKF